MRRRRTVWCRKALGAWGAGRLRFWLLCIWNIAIFCTFCPMPDQKPMWTRCLGEFSVMWVTILLISPVKKRIFAQNDQIWPKIGIFGWYGPGHAGFLVPCWWVGWRLWRAGCISQDTYLLYITWSKSKVLRPGLTRRNLILCPRASCCAVAVGLFVHCISKSQSKDYRPRQRRAVSLCDTSALLDEHNLHISRPTARKRGIQTFF